VIIQNCRPSTLPYPNGPGIIPLSTCCLVAFPHSYALPIAQTLLSFSTYIATPGINLVVSYNIHTSTVVCIIINRSQSTCISALWRLRILDPGFCTYWPSLIEGEWQGAVVSPRRRLKILIVHRVPYPTLSFVVSFATNMSLFPWALGWVMDKEYLLQFARQHQLVQGAKVDNTLRLTYAVIAMKFKIVHLIINNN